MYILNLFLFDGEGGGEGAAPAGGGIVETNESAQQDQRQLQFDEFIKQNKDLYDKRVQSQIDRRFKDTQRLQAVSDEYDSLKPMLDMLKTKYGAADYESLKSAIEEDDSFYEEAAFESGMTVEQYKRMAQLERENAELQKMREQKQQQENIDRQLAEWSRQEEETRQYYPQFDLKNELNAETGERLLGLLRAGVDVKTAYETIHIGELVGGAMAYTANAVRKQTVDNVRARGLRPQENGAGGSLGINTHIDIKRSTKAERDALARRAMRGERVTF